MSKALRQWKGATLLRTTSKSIPIVSGKRAANGATWDAPREEGLCKRCGSADRYRDELLIAAKTGSRASFLRMQWHLRDIPLPPIQLGSLIKESDLNKGRGSHLKAFTVSDIAALNGELTCEELNPEEWNVYRKGGSSVGTKQMVMRNAPLDFSSRYQEEFGRGKGFQ
ncbi:hypothetical protein TNIN_27551 [Trichonephila inaurata madagascariensis]|uniref:Uncharacterized protein n=1 Tax=Trichonephila inaurata madagascariensis TaxID=2747483 RepID=A0A8X6YGS4_9ARAC|nr:hypothetical protein TNIN_27551 [Trichonephila inaurata madagascariensis]